MIEEKYYEEFDYMKDYTYLDVASVGLQPKRTLDYCRGFQDHFVKSRGRCSLEGDYTREREKVVSTLARLVNCDEAEILLTTNTTEGNSIFVNSVNLQPGDNVISTSIEFPAVILGWAQRQSEGVELKLVPTENGCFDENELISMIDEKTKVVALSMVNNNTGFMPDIGKIGHACREKGVVFAVDAIQGLGRHRVDVSAMNIDYLSCGAFKGLLGVFGAGFVYCRKSLQGVLKPRYYSEDNIEFTQGSADGLLKMPVYSYRDGLLKMDGGSRNTYAIAALGVSVQMLLDIGIEQIEEKVLELERIFRRTIEELSVDVTILGREQERYWSGNICLIYAQAKYGNVKEAFVREHIYARVRPGDIRIALHYYNTPAQLKKVAHVLCEALN